MDKEKIKFSSGVESSLLDTPIVNGTARVTTDTESLYFEINDKRVEITDFVEVGDKAALDDILVPVSKKFYFVVSEGALYKYTADGWVSIGKMITENVVIDIPTEGWESDDDLKKVSIADARIRETDNPLATLGTTNPTDEQIAAYSSIKDAVTGDGKITVYAEDAISTEISLILYGIPKRD